MTVDVTKLKKTIDKITEHGWIDNNEGDAFDGEEFDIVVNSLKEYHAYLTSNNRNAQEVEE